MEKHGRNVSLIVKRYGKCGRRVSWIVKIYWKYRRKASRIVIRYGKNGTKQVEEWNDIKHMEEK